jgi:AraC family transcriptional regulator, transcriptional activator of pobA
MLTVQQFESTNSIIIHSIDKKEEDVMHLEPHVHNFWEIGYFEKGSGMHTIDFIETPIMDNTLYFLKKGIVHKIHRSKDSYGKVVLFDDSVFDDVMLKNRLPFVSPQIQVSEIILSKFKTLVNDLQDLITASSKQPLSKQYLHLLLGFYNHHAPSTYHLSEKIHPFLQYVEENFSAKLTVELCVQHLSISYQQLYQEVQKKLNKTPLDIIKERTLLEAKRLLYNTEHSVKEIAYALQFEDDSYFCKYFKSNVGLTPQQFRIADLKDEKD